MLKSDTRRTCCFEGLWLDATFKKYYSYFGAFSFIGGGTGVPGKNNRPAASHRQTLSHNAVSSTPRCEGDSNLQL